MNRSVASSKSVPAVGTAARAGQSCCGTKATVAKAGVAVQAKTHSAPRPVHVACASARSKIDEDKCMNKDCPCGIDCQCGRSCMCGECPVPPESLKVACRLTIRDDLSLSLSLLATTTGTIE